MLLALAFGCVLAAVVLPRLGGGTPYAVLTGSMSPAMPPGTLVIVRSVQPDDVTTGDVITFMPKENDPSVVTHRVVGEGFDATGARTFQTKGDANTSADLGAVHDYQLVGKRWYFVPFLGYVVAALSGEQRTIILYLVAAGLIGYALLMFGGALRDRLRRPVAEHA